MELLSVPSGVAALVMGLTGCTWLHSRVTEFDPVTGLERTTEATGYSMFDSKQALAKFSAGQGKTQRIGVGSLEQESAAPAEMINALGAGLGTAMRTFQGLPVGAGAVK